VSTSQIKKTLGALLGTAGMVVAIFFLARRLPAAGQALFRV